MKKFAAQLKKQAETIRLSTAERDDMRARLLAYMEYHPLPEEQAREGRRVRRRFQAGPGFLSGWMVGRTVGTLAVLFLVTLPALAENALPGDALYPIKVRFNEELRGAMTSSPYQKIEWETERLERRLAEAQLLADNGRLTAVAETEVANAIKQHTEAARASIDTIRRQDNEEATLAEITLASALEVSAEVWTKRETGSASSTVSGAVNSAKAVIAPSPANEVSYARLLSRVEAETTRAYEYLNGLNAVMTASERSDVDRRLNDLKVKVEAAAAIRPSDEAAAAKLLTEALGSARKLISFVTNLNVRRNVTVEELVPLIPTEAEKGELIRRKLEEAARLVAEIEPGLTRIATSSNDHVALTDTLKQYRELEKTATEALAGADLMAADMAVTEALELATALRQTLIGLGVVDAHISTATTTNRR